MAWSESYLRWVATDLIHDAVREALITHRLKALYNELMKISITEPVFFQGQNRQPGDVMEVEVGPYRTHVIPGGLTRIAQFVEMPEEIKGTVQAAAADVRPVASPIPTPPPIPPTPAPAPGSFAEATASVLKPAPPAPKPAGVSPSAQIAALTARRKKLDTTIASETAAYAKKLADVETKLPQVMTKANARLDDEMTSLGDLDTSLNDFMGANGGDPLSGS